MKLYAEEDVINTCLNNLNHKFKLKKADVTLVPGEKIKQSNQLKSYQLALNDSLTAISKDYHQPVPINKYQVINPETLYILIFHKTSHQNQLNLIFPYGANLATILAGALVQDRKNPRLNINQELDKLVSNTVDDLVLHEIYKYYQPAKGSSHPLSPKYTRSIRYQGLKSDSFNLMIKFSLPLNMTYQPLQKAIQQDSQKHHQAPKTNYNQLALSNLISLSYNQNTHDVTFITTLY